jgi:hypothetical protein
VRGGSRGGGRSSLAETGLGGMEEPAVSKKGKVDVCRKENGRSHDTK